MQVNWNFIDLMKRGREGYINNKQFREFFKAKAGIQGNEKILDVGCGIGTVPYLLNKIYGKNLQIFGIDLDSNLIEWGQRHWGKSENIQLAPRNIYKLDFSNNEFDIITSFGVLEWLEQPTMALTEMMRINKLEGKFITLVIEKSRYERFPSTEKQRSFYQDYLKGIENIGYPIENEGNYIQDQFSTVGFHTNRYEFLFETKTIITEKLLELWKGAFNADNISDFINNSKDFYFQFLREAGWNEDRLIQYLEEDYSLQNMLQFYRGHLGEEIGQRETIVLLESFRVDI